MAHDIYEKMFYSFEKPAWHGLGIVSNEPQSAEEIINVKFNGAFPIHLRPVYVELNGEMQEKTKDFAVVRGASIADPVELVLDYCSDRYQPLQPIDVARSFDQSVREPAETLAFLGNGREMFISWQMPSFEVRTGDELELFGVVKTGFDTLKGANLFTSIFRPVCRNTLNMAEGWAKKNTDGTGKGNVWKGKGVNKNLLRDLGYWMAHVQANAVREGELLQSFFGKLAKTPIKSDVEVHEILYTAYPPVASVSEFYPKQLQTAKEEKTVAFNNGQEQLRDGIYRLFAGAGTAITPDYWGMLNATTEYFNHYQPSKRPIAESVMFGGRQKNSMKMVSVLAERGQ